MNSRSISLGKITEGTNSWMSEPEGKVFKPRIVFLGCLVPAGHTEIYCGCSEVLGLKDISRESWKHQEHLRQGGHEIRTSSWSKCQVHTGRETLRGGCKQIRGPLNRRKQFCLFFLPMWAQGELLPLGTHGTSPPSLTSHQLLQMQPVKEMPFACAAWTALNYFVKGLKVQCTSVALKSWRECKKVDFCE